MRVKLGTLVGGDPIPSGTYQLELVKSEFVEFENSGSQGFKVQFKVVGGEFENRRVFENFVVLDKKGEPSAAIFRFAQFITCVLGDVEVELTEVEELKAVMEACFGKSFVGKIEVENDNQGRPRNRVTAYEA